jgi:hypothetical protein
VQFSPGRQDIRALPGPVRAARRASGPAGGARDDGSALAVHRAPDPGRRAGCPTSRVTISATFWWRRIT